jgi:outer membrane receptor for ferrienterochelin and colicin
VNSFPAGADPFGRTFGGYANGGGGIARGVEFSGSVSPRISTKIQAAYTYVNSDQRTPSSGTDYYRVLGQSPHVFTMTATQWLGTRTNVTFDLVAHSDYVATLSGSANRYRFSGPIKPDVVVTHRLPVGDDHKVEIYGKVENMFGQRAYEDGFIGARAWIISGVRINY